MPVSHYIPEDQCLSIGDQHSEKNVELSVFISYRYTALHEKGDTSRSPSRKGAKFIGQCSIKRTYSAVP